MQPTTRKKKLHDPRKPTNPLIWAAAIICAVIAVVVIVVGIVVFVGYMAIHPRVPFISVTFAHLDTIQYNQAGQLETQVTVVLTAENDNAKAHSSFSDTSFILSFQGLQIAKLVAEPFDVRKNSSTHFNYVVQSSQIPLDPTRMEEVDLSLKQDQITFDLKGSSRARWRVGLVGSVKFVCHLNCQLRFRPSNGTYIRSRCSSKSK
ncbi:NDR1/HIN1-like protein 12 [Alnus glutinosa]|uniref:NDR1/HIN1-like protein 12 n=1 Tax=Alnus glutinosa TaxID=3517 RepID=UPI002D7A198E|nr:NDR1/HIN1-like protein 12 [Alnus glutinosa]